MLNESEFLLIRVRLWESISFSHKQYHVSLTIASPWRDCDEFHISFTIFTKRAVDFFIRIEFSLSSKNN